MAVSMSRASSRRSSRSGTSSSRGIVGEHFPAAEGVVVAALAVDGDAHVPFFAVFLAGGRGQRRLERFEDHFLVDALLVGDGIDHHQDFLVHGLSTYPSSLHGASRALPISASFMLTEKLSTSISMLSPSVPAQHARVTLAPVARHLQLHLHALAHEALEMRGRAQHPVQPGRRHLERIRARKRIVGIEQFRHSVARHSPQSSTIDAFRADRYKCAMCRRLAPARTRLQRARTRHPSKPAQVGR